MNALEKAKKIAALLDEHKAKDIRVLKVSEQTVIADYFVICEGTSSTHIKALCDETEHCLKEDCGVTLEHREGYSSANWILLDYGDVIVHVFDKESREFFKLEKLWAGTEEIEF